MAKQNRQNNEIGEIKVRKIIALILALVLVMSLAACSQKENNNIYAKRDPDGTYMFYRRLIESRVRSMFIEKGGNPTRQTPHYMIIGKCDFCKTWYKCADYIEIPIEEFDMNTVSFTYGDTFPTFDPTHGDKSEYRQKIYTYDEIKNIIVQIFFW